MPCPYVLIGVDLSDGAARHGRAAKWEGRLLLSSLMRRDEVTHELRLLSMSVDQHCR